MNRDIAQTLGFGTGWRKSSYSEGANNCVEISTALPGWAGVRDAKLGDGGPVLALTHRQWRALLGHATGAHA